VWLPNWQYGVILQERAFLVKNDVLFAEKRVDPDLHKQQIYKLILIK
jgi:hypothetical protein